MRLAIVGSRSLTVNIEDYIPKDNIELIISGGAKGIDTLAEKYADENNIPKLIILPNYKKYGKNAPLIRNREIVDSADKILAIWDGYSSGTKHTIDYATFKRKKVELHIKEFD